MTKDKFLNGIDVDTQMELSRIYESSKSKVRYPSPFSHFIEYIKSGDKYDTINNEVGNQLLTLFYCDPGLFRNGVLKYSKDLQNAIFKFRESKEKVASEDYLNNIKGMHEEFDHLISYINEKGLDYKFLGNGINLQKITDEALRVLNIGRDVSRLYSDLIGFYIRLNDSNEAVSKFEHLFYKSPERFLDNLKRLNERSRTELSRHNKKFIESNKDRFEDLEGFLNGLQSYGAAYLGRNLTAKEFETIVRETKKITKEVFMEYNSLNPTLKEVKSGNLKIKVEFNEEKENYSDGPDRLLENLLKLGYPYELKIDRPTGGVKKYAYELSEIANSLIDFDNGNPNINLSNEFKNLENVGRRIGSDTVFGVVIVDGKEEPINYHLSVIYKFLKDKIRCVDFNATPREEDKLEMITEEEYEKLVEGGDNGKSFSDGVEQKSNGEFYVETREPLYTKGKENKKEDKHQSWWATEEGRRMAWNYKE